MITDPHKTRYLNIENQQTPIWIYGDEKNPLIFFIHGHFRGFSDYIGDLPMRYLMKDYYVVAFDLPGYGKSKEINMDRVEFVKSVINQTSKSKPFVLFGGSYGGLLSIKYSLKYPERVRGIIIGGMPYYFGIRQIVSLSTKIPLVNKLRVSKILKEFEFLSKDNLAKLKVPVLLLYSRGDHQATPKMAKALQKIIPDASLSVIKGLNHGWLMHRIDQSGFLGEIEKFVKNLL